MVPCCSATPQGPRGAMCTMLSSWREGIREGCTEIQFHPFHSPAERFGAQNETKQPESRFTDCFRILLQLQTFQGVSSLTRDRQSCSHKKPPGTSLCTSLKHLQLLLQAETPEFSQISSGKGKSQGILLLTGSLKGSFSATCGLIQKQKWNQWDSKHNWCPAADALPYSWVLTPSCHVHEENEL